MTGKTKNAFILPGRGIDLDATLFCGQSFSWHREADGAFVGVAGRHAARVWKTEDDLCVEPLGTAGAAAAGRGFWERYFALDVDYGALQARFCRDATLAECVACAPGVRVLRQPFFDTLLSFILSQNNNIPRITGIAQRLREGFGPALAEGLWGFPAAEDLCGLSVEDLAPLRAGFRAKYLLEAARAVADGRVTEEKLAALPNGEARALLCTIKGVGPKVADCVLLFGLSRGDVAPMDVWMKRAMERHFPAGWPKEAKGFEGIAQQYVFCRMRGEAAQEGAPE